MSSHSNRRRHFIQAITTAAAISALALGLPSVADAGVAPTTTTAHQSPASSTYIVRLAGAPAPASLISSVSESVRAAGGRVVSVEPAIGMLVITLPANAVATIDRLTGVLGVTADIKAHPMSLGFDPSTQPGSMTDVTKLTGAQSLWNQGITGAGVDVAVIDTGQTPVPALADSNKVLVGPDLSFEGQSLPLRYLDTFGHGTAMGSIIAGREVAKQAGSADATDTTHFYGMAPDARLVDIKVGSSDGSVDVSQLIAAIDWVVQNRDDQGAGSQLNIRVLNLSFGTDSTQAWQVDPLAQAAEVATRDGILVVAAAGNDGSSTVGLADPAYDPHILAVGAVDTKGTASYADDTIPTFSQHSDGTKGVTRGPDLVAPGVGIVSAAVPGSAIATQYPAALLGGGAYIRGSGTSQAAAVTSGAAALLFQKYPNATGVQIEALLVDSAAQVGTSPAPAEGRGEINLQTAWNTPLRTAANAPSAMPNMSSATATGTGTLQGSRGTQSVTIDGKVLSGEKDIFGATWDTAAHATLAEQRSNWGANNGALNGNYWSGGGFVYETASVAGKAWGGRSWAFTPWTASSWSGNPWTGRTWAGRTWSGRTWAGNSWGDPVSNANSSWASQLWASSSWR